MNKRGTIIWDVIAWIVLAGIAVWLLLKALGIINTPVLIEYAPYFGAVYLAGWHLHKLKTVADDIGELKKFKGDTIRQIQDIKSKCPGMHG